MKIRLFVPWQGPLPKYLEAFMNRVEASKPLVEVIILPHSANTGLFQRAIMSGTGAQAPATITPRKICDYRPAFADIFSTLMDSADWWGWCDLDCVFGDFPAFLTPERLEEFDLITDHKKIVNGPFTIMRNTSEMRNLYRSDGRWRECFQSATHMAFDELAFTQIVRARPQIKVCYLDAHVHDGEAGPPHLRENKLYSGRKEILTYHFKKRKRWPWPTS